MGDKWKRIEKNKVCAIIASSLSGHALKVRKYRDFRSMIKEYGPINNENPMVAMGKVMFQNGINELVCVSSKAGEEATKEDYKKALKVLIDSKEKFYGLVSDTKEIEVIKEMLKVAQNDKLNPGIVFIGLDQKMDLETIKKLPNRNRLIIVSSQGALKDQEDIFSTSLSAACVTAKVINTGNPTDMIRYEEIKGLTLKTTENKGKGENLEMFTTLKNRAEDINAVEIDRLVFVNNGKDGETINQILIKDYVLSTIKRLLFTIKNSRDFKDLTITSLMAQIILLLSLHQDRELIIGYEIPKIEIKDKIEVSVRFKPNLVFETDELTVKASI